MYFASRVWPCLFTSRTKLIPMAAHSRTAGHQDSILALQPMWCPRMRFNRGEIMTGKCPSGCLSAFRTLGIQCITQSSV